MLSGVFKFHGFGMPRITGYGVGMPPITGYGFGMPQITGYSFGMPRITGYGFSSSIFPFLASSSPLSSPTTLSPVPNH